MPPIRSFSPVAAYLFWTLLSPASLLIAASSSSLQAAASAPTVDNAVAMTVSALASAAGLAANSSDRAMDTGGHVGRQAASSAANNDNTSRRATDEALTQPGALSAKGFPAPSIVADGKTTSDKEDQAATTTATSPAPGALSAKGFPAPSIAVSATTTTKAAISTTTTSAPIAAAPLTSRAAAAAAVAATAEAAKPDDNKSNKKPLDSVDSDETILPLSWEEAYQKAEETLAKMTISLLQLSGFCPSQQFIDSLLFQELGNVATGEKYYGSQGLYLTPRPCGEGAGRTRWVLSEDGASQDDDCTGLAYTSAASGAVPLGQQTWHVFCGQHRENRTSGSKKSPVFEENSLLLREVPQGEKYALLSLLGYDSDSLGGHSSSHRPNKKGFYMANVPGIERLSVPSLNMHGGATGFRPIPGSPAKTATYFPSPLALAATWDPRLVEEVAQAVGKEFHLKGANVLIGPSFNLNRDCRGRFCSDRLSGEDPELGVRLARAFVRGAQSQGVMVVAKHSLFEQDDDARNKVPGFDPLGSEAFENYYPAFQAAIEAGLGGVMPVALTSRAGSAAPPALNITSSNSNNNKNFLRSLTNSNINSNNNNKNNFNAKLAASTSNDIVSDAPDDRVGEILRDDLGFKGFLQTDLRSSEDGLLQPKLGQESSDGNMEARALLPAAPTSVDTAAKRILASAYHMRLDETTECSPPSCETFLARNVTSPAHIALARRAAAASMVLLKNDHDILPLESGVETIAVVGTASVTTPHVALGDGRDDLSEDVDTSLNAPSPLEAIIARAGENHAIVRGSPTNDPKSAAQVSKNADVAIIFAAAVPRNTTGGEEVIGFPDDLEELIDSTKEVARYTVVVVETPAALPLPWHNKADAVLINFMAGQAAPEACADLLFGDTSPSGRLPVSIPESTTAVAYPFGHGLGFGKFQFSTPQRLPCDSGNEDCRLKFRSVIKNIGNHSSAHVLQMYITFPPEVGPATRRLKSFKKSKLIAPGEHREVNFTLTRKDVSRWNRMLGDWDEAAGTYSVELADSVVKPRQSLGFCVIECSIEKDGAFVIFGTLLGAAIFTVACLTLAVKKSPGHAGYRRVKEPALEPLDAPLQILA